jgi:hypothetical protein
MRKGAPLAVLLALAGCTSVSTPPAPPASQAAPAAPAIAPTAAPSPGTELVPTIHYPDAPGAGSMATAPPSPSAPAGAGVTDAPGADAPADAPSADPGPDAPSAMTIQLAYMPLSLDGFKVGVSPSDARVLLYQAGPNEDALTEASPGSLRVGFRLSATRVAGKTIAIEAATVRYTQLSNGVRSSWLANYKPGDANATLTLDASVADGRLSFNLKGLLASDSSSGGFFGGFGTTSATSMYLDWRVTSAGLPTPATTTTSPSPSPTPFKYF